MKHGLAGNSALACAEDEYAKEPADKEAEIHLQKKRAIEISPLGER